MPHMFDTGATKAQRTLVREAVVARLAGLRKSAVPARYLTAIAELPRRFRGEGDAEGLDMLMKAFNGACPAVAVALGRMPLEGAGLEPNELRGELDVSVYAASQHSRDLVAGRLAADVIATASLTADPGVETILEHVAERLLGQGLGVDGVSEPRGTEEDIVATFGDITVGELTFTVKVERKINPSRATVQLVTSIENQLDADAIPDGTVGYDPFVTTVANIDP